MLYPVTPKPVSVIKLAKQRWKFLLLTFVIGVMLPKGLGTMLSANVVDWDANHYSNIQDPESVLVAFHTEVNDITNRYLKLLMNEDIKVDMTPVAKEECGRGSLNVSAWCLSVELNEEMLYAQARLLETKESSGVSTLDFSESFSDQVEKLQYIQDKLVDDEMAIMEDSVELTMAVYSQLMLVYPLHNELWELKDRLTIYQNELQNIRAVVEKYPGKFNDASTIHCK